jgi:hypothetical protein
MEYLDLNTAKTLKGKTVRFKAPSYQGNYPYEGVFKIEEVNVKERRLFSGQRVSGDSLEFAFTDECSKEGENKAIYFSDSGRYVTFEVLN